MTSKSTRNAGSFFGYGTASIIGILVLKGFLAVSNIYVFAAMLFLVACKIVHVILLGLNKE